MFVKAIKFFSEMYVVNNRNSLKTLGRLYSISLAFSFLNHYILGFV